MKILVVFDGSTHAKTALKHGITRCRKEGGEVMLLSVFEKGLFVDRDAGPAAAAQARQEFSGLIREAKELADKEGADVPVRSLSADGDPKTIVVETALTEGADLILAPPRFRYLTGISPVPVQIIPGTILMPVDSTDAPFGAIEHVEREALGTASNVVVLGIVPVHLYASSEKKELEDIRRKTSVAVRRMKRLLVGRGISVDDATRSGYPDEEILKAAEGHDASLIILPAGSSTPSELSKAASVLIDEPQRLKSSLFLVPVDTAA